MSIAEVEGALLELRDLSRSKMWERMQEIIKAIDPADYAPAFALAPKLSPECSPASVYCPLALGGTRSRSAMEAANGIKNFNDRHQAILAVLRGWAKDDQTSAAAWVAQLPAGRLRNDAQNAIAQQLAETDPEAAFACSRIPSPPKIATDRITTCLISGVEGPGRGRRARG